MSYNRLDFNNGHNTAYNPHTPLQDLQSHSRVASPPARQHGYQLQDTHPGYHPGAPLEIPMGPPSPGRFTPSDELAPQPSYSVENIPNTYGHNENYEQRYQGSQQDYRPAGPQYAQSPHPHQHQLHDTYWQDDYESTLTPENGAQTHVYPPHHGETGPYIEDDQQPILRPEGPYGPDPHTAPGADEEEYYSDADEEEPLKPENTSGLKRHKTVKEVQLYHGNLVLDCPIPPRLLNQVPHAQPPERDEFTHMRYTAATCDPRDFAKDHFTLRQCLFAKRRHTELFIVVTMYNEDEILFARTMSGVFKNIAYMCSRKDSKTWGKEAWKKIVVCVVSDGRAKINPRTRAVLAGMGVYQEGIAKQQVNGKDVTAHVYEYTTQTGVEIKNDVVRLVPKGETPVQMLFCLKEKNQKKINSHRWFFQAFGAVLEPNICVLIDAGTRPGKDSIYQLWKAFDVEPMCAGACGEIKAGLGNLGKELLNPIVATQNFEYKMSNILDKPLESAFGFITVLPGAFSAYRYVALQNNAKGEGPLQKYFLGEEMHGENAGIFTANMYLAEDRILCFELVSKRRCNWILQYVKSATGETDVPDTVAELIMQRRRWLNGSFFAAIYALAHFYQLFRSDHTAIRKMMFLLEFTYQTINMLFAWFAIGNFFLVFRILTTSLGDPSLHFAPGKVLSVVFEWLYLATLLACFVLSMGNRPQGSNKFYMTMVYFWAVLMVYLMFASIYITVISIQTELADHSFTVSDLFKNSLFFTLIVSLASTYLLYFFISFLFFDPWHMFTSFIQYLLLTPTYINILNVYAFCNTHDITWGTKGDDKAATLPTATLKPGTNKMDIAIPTDDADLNTQYTTELTSFANPAKKEKKMVTKAEKQEDYYKGFRSATVLVWMFCNFALAAAVLQTAGVERVTADNSATENMRATIYMAVVLWSVAGLSAFRFVGAVWFLIVRLFRGV